MAGDGDRAPCQAQAGPAGEHNNGRWLFLKKQRCAATAWQGCSKRCFTRMLFLLLGRPAHPRMDVCRGVPWEMHGE